MGTKEMKKIAEITASLVLEGLKGQIPTESKDDEYIDSKEAARLLGLTPNYLRAQKDRFPHIKVGNNSQGRILFKKSELMSCYTK